MNTSTRNIALILREFIRAHHERGDFDIEQRYIPRLTRLVEEMERSEFEELLKEGRAGAAVNTLPQN